MVDINLYNNRAFKWHNNGSVFGIGYILENGNIIKDDELIKYFEDIDTLEKFSEIIKNAKGFFSIVIKKESNIMIASDIIRSFPVFIQKNKNRIIISDDINYFKNKIINQESVEELLATGYVTGKETLYKEIIQLQNAEIIDIKIEDLSIKKKKYFEWEYNIDKIFNEEKLIEKLDDLYNQSIKELIKFLDGRKAIIPLSGGHDSRLIAYYLRKNNYTNVITYTYGRKNNPEAVVSKKVADYLNFEWHFVEYKNSSMQKKYSDVNKYSDMADYCARGFSTTHIQEWEAIEELLKNNIIKESDVVVPGFSGDFIAGSHLNNELIEEKTRTYKEVKAHVLKVHYNLYNWKKEDINDNIYKTFCKKIDNIIKNNNDDEQIDTETFNSLIEKFDFEERQVKFISNSVRTYDRYGLQWYMPLWDKDIIKIWLTIPLEQRYERNLYKRYADIAYGDLMEYAPTVKNLSKKTYKNKILKAFHSIIRLYSYYFRHFLNYYGYIKFSEYLKLCSKYKSGSYYFMFSYKYYKYIKLKERSKNEN